MRFLQADQVFDGIKFLDSHEVLVLNDQNLLKEIVSRDTLAADKIEKLTGIVTPGFVNAHCHLELSHLHAQIQSGTGLPGFARQIISLRNKYSEEEISEKMAEADVAMWADGIVAVGDISNVRDSFHLKKNSKVRYHTFIELLGFDPKNSAAVMERGKALLDELTALGLNGSLAAHSPYSSSLELIREIAEYDHQKGLPFSIHNQESEEETKFFHGRNSEFHDLYNFLNLDISFFKPTGTSSLKTYAASLSAKPSLLVHNTSTNSEDLHAIKNTEVYWCFCPASNIYIDKRLPDFSVFSNRQERICLGTDSLASNEKLDLVREANLLLSSSKVFTLENILKMMTSNGAHALNLKSEAGALITGKNTGLNHLTFDDSQLKFIRKLA